MRGDRAVRAFEEGRAECTPWGRIDVPPGGLKSPNPPGGRAVLKLMREHGGGAIAVATGIGYFIANFIVAHQNTADLARLEFRQPSSQVRVSGNSFRARGQLANDAKGGGAAIGSMP